MKLVSYLKSNKPVILIGGGGHAAGLAEIIQQQSREILAVVAPELSQSLQSLGSFMHYTSDDDVYKFSSDQVELVNAIGAMPYQVLRKAIFTRFKEQGYQFATVVADSAIVSPNTLLEEGVQVMQNAVICIGSTVRENTIINTSASIDHDCLIGANCHIAPGVTMSGQVNIEDGVHISTGANIINNITVGKNTIVGVGASVTADLQEGVVAFGSRLAIKEQRKL